MPTSTERKYVFFFFEFRLASSDFRFDPLCQHLWLRRKIINSSPRGQRFEEERTHLSSSSSSTRYICFLPLALLSRWDDDDAREQQDYDFLSLLKIRFCDDSAGSVYISLLRRLVLLQMRLIMVVREWKDRVRWGEMKGTFFPSTIQISQFVTWRVVKKYKENVNCACSLFPRKTVVVVVFFSFCVNFDLKSEDEESERFKQEKLWISKNPC